jgi:tetratricopeptide (TPR) repeat protein
MILHLPDDLSRGVLVALAILVGGWLSFFGIRAAIAQYGSEKNEEKPLEMAARLEPRNYEYWQRLGQYEEGNLENQDFDLARKYFQKAIALNPGATDSWMGLGEIEEASGNFAEAQAAYLQAKKSYPSSSEPAWRYGNFLIRRGKQTQAYAEIRRALEADPKLAAQAFTRVYRFNPDINEIFNAVLPADPAVYLEVVLEAVNQKQLTVAKAAWARLIALHPKLSIQDIDMLVSRLGLAGELSEARRIWDEGTATMDLPPFYRRENSVVWDPSFESDVNGYSFTWHHQPMVQQVAIALDKTERHSGAQSLRLSFDGKHNPKLDAACTFAAVQPGGNYEFSGWIKTNKITTDHGIGFRLRSVEDTGIPVSTQEIHGTNPWTLVSQGWVAGPHTQTVEICVIREQGYDTDIHISGKAWIDDVNLVPEF